MERGGSIEWRANVRSTKLEASVTYNSIDSATANAKNRATVDPEARTAVKAEAQSPVTAEDRSAVTAKDRVPAKAEDRSAVIAEARATVNAEDRATLIVEAPTTVKGEGRAAVNAGGRAAINADGRASVNTEDRETLIVEAPTTFKAEHCAAVNAEDRATVKAEARATVKAGDRATVNAGDRATVNPEARATVSAEGRATVMVEAPTTAKAEDRATVNAGDRATLMVEVPTNAKAEDRAAVNAEYRATVNAEARATVNAEARATVNAEDRATLMVEAPTTAKAEDRATVNAEYRATVDAGYRATVKVEDGATFTAEDGATLNAGDSSDLARGRLERSRELDSTRTARSKDALAGMCPAQKALGIARRNLSRLQSLPKDYADLVKERLSCRLRAIDKDLNLWRLSKWNTPDENAAIARRREDLLARKEDNLALARMDVQEMLKEVAKRNRAKRMARRVIYRRPRRVTEDSKKVETKARKATEAIDFLARKEDNLSLASMDPQERLKEFCKRNRAKRMAIRAISRGPRRVTEDSKKAETEEHEDTDAIVARILRGLDSGEYSLEGIRARRELSRALTEMDPQDRAREIARMFRANRVAICVVQRQRRMAQAKERGKLSAALAKESYKRKTAKHYAWLSQQRNQEHAADAEARAGQAESDYSGGSDSAEARQEDLSATREHAHARALAEADDPRELQRGGDRGDGEGRVEIRSDQAKGGGVTADEAGATDEKNRKLQTDGQALVDGIGAGEVELQTGGTEFVGGTGTGGVDGKAASVGGTGDGIGTGEVELQTGGTERVDGIGAGEVVGKAGAGDTGDGIGTGEVDGKAAGVDGTGDDIGAGEVGGKAASVDGTGDGIAAGEVDEEASGVAGTGDGTRAGELEQQDGTERLDGIGTGEASGKAAVVDGAGAVEFPVIDVELEAIRANAIAEAAARAVRDAVEINRKTDLARARHAEKARRRAEKKEKLERKASRDARRRKKLHERESREKRKKGERLGPPVEGMEEPARVEKEAVAGEGGGMLAQGDVRGGVHAAAAAAAVGTETRAEEANGRRATADESSATGAKKQKLQTDGHTALDGIGTGEGLELQRDGIEVLDGMGAGGVDHGEAGNDGSGSGAGGFPFVDVKQEELRAKAAVKVAERVARDAVEANRKADLARARHAEKARRRAKRQEKVERKASRDARRDERRLMKLQDRESRRLSQREAASRTVSSEGSSENAKEVIFRGGKSRGIAVGGGGGSGDESGGNAGGAAGADVVSAYDFVERATRFESSFAAADAASAETVIPITILASKASFEQWLGSQTPQSKSRIKGLGDVSHKAGSVVVVPSDVTEGEGAPAEVAFCVGEGEGSLRSPFSLCSLWKKLPAGTFALRESDGKLLELDAAALSWALGSYSFDRYQSKSGSETPAKADHAEEEESNDAAEAAVEGKVLAWPGGCDKRRVSAAATAIFLVRDLISTKPEDMGPQHLEDVMAALAKEFHGSLKVVKGDDLLKEGDSYPMIHAIGCAAVAGREPRLLDMTWTPPSSEGNRKLPKVTLVGKGVCFDTRGLDPKPAPGTVATKNDMGGGAQVLGLARMIMAQELPIRLRVLVPAVEVAIGGDDEFKSGCFLVGRNGAKSEVVHTENAEGLLVLADALVEASSESPDLIIDCATLTGAARVALGTEISAFFCKDEDVAAKMHSLSGKVFDQVWRRPLWDGYPRQLSSKVVRLRTTGGGYGGAVSAALYLDEFVGKKASAESQESGSTGRGPGGKKLPWIHMDFLGFNSASRPGRPEGGEAQGMRTLFALLEDMFVA